jgi:hypothetical protein
VFREVSQGSYHTGLVPSLKTVKRRVTEVANFESDLSAVVTGTLVISF